MAKDCCQEICAVVHGDKVDMFLAPKPADEPEAFRPMNRRQITLELDALAVLLSMPSRAKREKAESLF